MAKLTHRDLLVLGQKLDYLVDKKGLCKGFSLLLAHQLFDDEENRKINLQKFFDRLDLIARYKGNFDHLISDVKEVRALLRDQARAIRKAEEEGQSLDRNPQLDERAGPYLEIIADYSPRLHFKLDVVMDEDQCPIYRDDADRNLNIMRKIVLKLLVEEKSSQTGITFNV